MRYRTTPRFWAMTMAVMSGALMGGLARQGHPLHPPVVLDAASNQARLAYGVPRALQPQAPLTGRLARDKRWLAQLIEAEAGNQPSAAQIAVGAVVVNRLHAPSFPHHLWAVLHQPNQFETVANGTFATAQPSASAIHAATLALKGVDPTHDALYFYNPALPHAAWMDTLTGCKPIGAMDFCRTTATN